MGCNSNVCDVLAEDDSETFFSGHITRKCLFIWASSSTSSTKVTFIPRFCLKYNKQTWVNHGLIWSLQLTLGWLVSACASWVCSNHIYQYWFHCVGTGVAYANLSVGSDTIRWIQRWPGRMQANENKVGRTTNSYFSLGANEFILWGLLLISSLIGSYSFSISNQPVGPIFVGIFGGNFHGAIKREQGCQRVV